jgi:hypothetical protein
MAIPQQTSSYKEIRNVSENNVIGLCSLIQIETLSEVLGEKWESVYSTFNNYFNIACPTVTRNIIRVPEVYWINKDTVIAKTRLKELYNPYRQSWIQELRHIYKAYMCKKQYNVIIKMAKSNYFQNIITNSNNTTKVLRKIVKTEGGSSNNALTSNIYLQDGNEICLKSKKNM